MERGASGQEGREEAAAPRGMEELFGSQRAPWSADPRGGGLW